MTALNDHVLVLNKSWAPVDIATARRALCLVFNDQAYALDQRFQTYDFASWRELSAYVEKNRRVIFTPTYQIAVPYVIVLRGYNRMPSRKVRLSRRNVFARDSGICQYCGRKPPRDEFSIDHVVPRSRGGRSTWTNLVLACTDCNMKKDNRTPEEAGMKLLVKPAVPRWPFVGSVRIDKAGLDFWSSFVTDAYWNVKLES